MDPIERRVVLDLNASTPVIRLAPDCRRSDRRILSKTKSVLREANEAGTDHDGSSGC
jgi:hypothetical protein